MFPFHRENMEAARSTAEGPPSVVLRAPAAADRRKGQRNHWAGSGLAGRTLSSQSGWSGRGEQMAGHAQVSFPLASRLHPPLVPLLSGLPISLASLSLPLADSCPSPWRLSSSFPLRVATSPHVHFMSRACSTCPALEPLGICLFFVYAGPSACDTVPLWSPATSS